MSLQKFLNVLWEFFVFDKIFFNEVMVIPPPIERKYGKLQEPLQNRLNLQNVDFFDRIALRAPFDDIAKLFYHLLKNYFMFYMMNIHLPTTHDFIYQYAVSSHFFLSH